MKRSALAILMILTIFSLSIGMAAGNIFSGSTSTKSGLSTWDSDLVNIEQVTQTGKGVYVAVLDTGLTPNWKDYFPEARINTKLGKGFEQPISFKAQNDDPCGVEASVGQMREAGFIGSSTSTHGTHVTSTILGYFYRSNSDASQGYPLPPVMIRGIAPEVTIIPVKVLADYQVPALPKCNGGTAAETINFGTSEMVAAGLNYVASLARAGYRPMVVNMSLGGGELEPVEQAALDNAISSGVIVVASAGNEGEAGMGYPGAYAPVISVGSAGWTKEWLVPAGPTTTRYRLWWLQSSYYAYTDIPEPTPAEQVYVSEFSSRELAGQQLDVLAPGSWVRGPMPGDSGYSHLPWWSKGIADLKGVNPGNFYYVGGTSMAAPHVSALSALMLQKNPGLTQAQVESILKSTALAIAPGAATVFDLSPVQGFYNYSWGANAVGSGLIQANAALAAVP
jgi:subtilisin family serine protease